MPKSTKARAALFCSRAWRCRRTAVREMTAGSVAGDSAGYPNNRFLRRFDERMRAWWDGSFPTRHTGRHMAKDPRFKGLSPIAFLDDAPRRVTGAILFAEAASGAPRWCLGRQSGGSKPCPRCPRTAESCFAGARRGEPKGPWQPTAFDGGLPDRRVRPINSKSYRPQTSGKPERF